MHIAVIDLGTNTFQCLIAGKTTNNGYEILHRTSLPVKLGEDGINQGFIAPAAFKRGIDALTEFKKVAEKYSVEKIIAFGTSAFRTAINKNVFLCEAKKKTGIDISVISGKEEAEYIYYGVKQTVETWNGTSLIMDVGGGSVEFIIVEKERLLWEHSFDTGVARMVDKFNPSSQITEEEITAMESWLNDSMQLLFDATSQFSINTLLGSSGAFETFYELIAYQTETSPELPEKATEMKLSMYEQIHRQLLKSTREERAKTKAISEIRADMIVPASVLVNFIVKKIAVSKIMLSTGSLKEGVLWSLNRKP